MGVPGLETFVQQQRGLGELVQANGLPPVVVDGKGLEHYLYQHPGPPTCDLRFSGDYEIFAQHARAFLQRLADLSPSVLVVFDGVMVTAKLQEDLRRMRERIATVASVVASIRANSCAPRCHGKLVPPLLTAVFQELLQEMGIPFEVCCEEGDAYIAHVAQQRGACVLGRDSDFFIFDVPGYIPLPTLEWRLTPVRYTFFRRHALAVHLGVSVSLLPLFACILGNDFVSGSGCLSFRAQFGKRRDEQFRGVATWLSSFTGKQEALQSLYSDDAYRPKLARDTLTAALELYCQPGIRVGIDIVGLPPDWWDRHATGQLSSRLLSLAVFRRVKWPVVMEDTSRAQSCWARLRPLSDSLAAWILRDVQAPGQGFTERLRVAQHVQDRSVVLPLVATSARPSSLRAFCALPAPGPEVPWHWHFVLTCVQLLIRYHSGPLSHSALAATATLALCSVGCSDVRQCATLSAQDESSPVTLLGVQLVAEWVTVVLMARLIRQCVEPLLPVPKLRFLADGRLLHSLLARPALSTEGNLLLACPQLTANLAVTAFCELVYTSNLSKRQQPATKRPHSVGKSNESIKDKAKKSRSAAHFAAVTLQNPFGLLSVGGSSEEDDSSEEDCSDGKQG